MTSEVVDKIMSMCKFGDKNKLSTLNKYYYTCSTTGFTVFEDGNKWVGKYHAVGLTHEEAEELWYKIENKPIIKCRKHLLKWLGLGNK